MGLRLRIAILLLLPLALLAAVAQWLLHRDMERHVAALEVAEATGDLRRVLVAFEGQAQNLSGVLRSWANWSDLYDHMVQPTQAFRTEELTPEALSVAQFDWLALHDVQGRFVDFVEVPRPDGSRPATAEIESQSRLYAAHFAGLDRRPGCGLVRAAQRLALMCFSPVHRSDGTGDYVGQILIGRWVDTDMLAKVVLQTGRNVQLLLRNPGDAVPQPPRSGPLFALDTPTIVQETERLLLSVPVSSLFGRTVGELRMEWPRRNMAEAAERLAGTQRVMVLLVLVSGALLVLLLDQLVVKRLARLRHELAQVMEEGDWHGSVTPSGRDEIGELAGFFNQLLDLVRRQMGELRNLSTTDALTGLPNRRAFDERLNYLLVRHARQTRAAALIVLDVDHFKPYNDALGHPAGDEALKAIARCLQTTVRRQLDMPARIGGEEFGVLLEDAGTDGALACAEGVRLAVEAAAIPHPNRPDLAHLSVSAGVATFRPGDTADALYQRADHALYASKQAGRNRVTLAD